MCQCSPKIPINMIDLNLYFDQFGKRSKYIGPVNVSETRLNISRMEWKAQEKDRSDGEFERIETYSHSEFSERQTEDKVDFENNIPESLINVDELYHNYERTSDSNTNKYPNLARAAIRYGVSDRAVAAICN